MGSPNTTCLTIPCTPRDIPPTETPRTPSLFLKMDLPNSSTSNLRGTKPHGWTMPVSARDASSASLTRTATKTGKASVVAVYAPWCQFCQGMEENFEAFAAQADVDVYKFRGDEERE